MCSLRESVKKCGTDSDRSRSSGSNGLKFWLPSLSSKSSSSSCKRVPLPSLLLRSNQPSLNPERTTEQDVLADSFGRLSMGASSSEVMCGTQSGNSAVGPAAGQRCTLSAKELSPERTPSSVASTAIAYPRAEAAELHQRQLDWEMVQKLHLETGIPLEECGNAQSLMTLIPRNDRGQLSSVGSIGHQSGQCSPCLFWFKGVCAKGLYCSYCHIRHKGQKNKRIRPSKKTRKQMRDFWESVPGSASSQPLAPEALSDDDDEGQTLCA